jgi:fumarate reductase flavoprotein subunit
MGVNKAAFLKTIEEYNEACQTGRDNAFGKAARYLRPVEQPRFYASKRVGMPGGKPEGIRINYRTEVLTKEHETIPGLYAAGMDTACNIYYDLYVNYLPGNAYGWALNSGRMAAENALEYIKSK